jgi:hypothetical protein
MDGVILLEPTRITQLKKVIRQVGPEHTEAIEALVICIYQDWLDTAKRPGFTREDLIKIPQIGIDQVKEYKTWGYPEEGQDGEEGN